MRKIRSPASIPVHRAEVTGDLVDEGHARLLASWGSTALIYSRASQGKSGHAGITERSTCVHPFDVRIPSGPSSRSKEARKIMFVIIIILVCGGFIALTMVRIAWVGSRTTDFDRSLLKPDERIIASALCQPPGAIERQAWRPVKVILTDQRLVGFRVRGRVAVANSGDEVFSVPVGDLLNVSLAKKFGIGTLGIPITHIDLGLRDGSSLSLRASGAAAPGARRLGEAVEAAVASS